MVPSISATPWEQGLSCRVVLFRDWGWEDGDGEGKAVDDVRIAEIVKVEGRGVGNGRRRCVGFVIDEVRILSISAYSNPPFINT